MPFLQNGGWHGAASPPAPATFSLGPALVVRYLRVVVDHDGHHASP
ncbi:MAG: hypothetical protein QOJ30_2588 [Pseudonocardiales bacterium]|jgi:hypothetical protein|nr:hypothetical protein [Pseudonocardia sp.]MDT7700263.1 hypothetical protein [Pseudonocardiales bacterium]